MSDFKNILVYVGIDKGCRSRLQLAAELAQEFSAHLTGLHVVPQAVYTPYSAIQFPTETYDKIQHHEQEISGKLKDLFHEVIADNNITGYLWQEVKSSVKKGDHLVAHQAHYQDLLILPQSAHDTADDNHITPEASILEGSAPVIVTPENTDFPTKHGSIAVAWNASPQASRALHAALPLLKQAAEVNVMIINTPGELPHHESIDHTEKMQRYLDNHGVKATIYQEDNAQGLKIGELLLQLSEKHAADMLVMGGYSHPRLIEALLSEASYNILQKSKIPVFISH